MTGIIYNNNEYIINTGNSKIEYSAMGSTNSSYSMYGNEIPVLPSANKFIQPVFTSSDSGFTTTECTKEGFTIYTDSAFYNRGVGYAFDGNLEPNGQDTYGATNIWHSDQRMPHCIGFGYKKKLRVHKLEIWNGTVNCVPKDWVLQCKINGEFVNVISGQNTNQTGFAKWDDIIVTGNYESEEWKLVINSSWGIDSNYTSLLEMKIDADIVPTTVSVRGDNGYVKVTKYGTEYSNRNYWDTGVRLSCEDNDTFSIEATYIPDMVYGSAHNYLFSEQGYYKGWYAGIYSYGRPWVENYYSTHFYLDGTFTVEMNKPITYKVQGTLDDVILTISQGEHTETLHRGYHINFDSYNTYKIGNASLGGGETIFSGEMTKFEIIKNNETLFTLNDL